MNTTETMIHAEGKSSLGSSPRVSHPYADKRASSGALERGQAARLRRLDAQDMANTDEAAAAAGVTRATVISWIRKGRCIGLARAKRGFRLPVWQFEPVIFEALSPISAAMDTTDGWALLSFMETPHGGLDGLTPRQALEQGQRERVVAIAGAH